MLTLGIGGIGVVAAYFSYTPETAARSASNHHLLDFFYFN